MHCLFDTGILLRLFDRSDPNHATVRESVRLLHRIGHQPVIAIQNAVVFWNVMTRPAAARGGFGLSVATTHRRLQHLRRRFAVLAENLLVFDEWMRITAAHGVSGRAVHDARLVAQMLVSQVPTILTLNPGDFRRYSAISVVTPMEFLAANAAP